MLESFVTAIGCDKLIFLISHQSQPPYTFVCLWYPVTTGMTEDDMLPWQQRLAFLLN